MGGLSAEDKAKLGEVQLLLWAGWDPIGCGVPRDEYDTYAGIIFGKLKHGAKQGEIISYLLDIEANHMGLTPRPWVSEVVAEKAAIIVHGEGYDFGAETAVRLFPFRRS